MLDSRPLIIISVCDLLLEFEELGFLRPVVSTTRVPRSFKQFSSALTPFSSQSFSSQPSREGELEKSDLPTQYDLPTPPVDPFSRLNFDGYVELQEAADMHRQPSDIRSTDTEEDVSSDECVVVVHSMNGVTMTNDREAFLDLVFATSGIFMGQRMSQDQLVKEKSRTISFLSTLKVNIEVILNISILTFLS